MDLQLSDKVAIVTGASHGIGRAIALLLAKEGMRLVVAARTLSELEELAEECAAAGAQCLVHRCDLREPEAPAALVAAAQAHFGRIDLLVNNAGATKRGDFLALEDADWMDGFALKFFGAMRCARAAWPHLRASEGTVINIAGIGGRIGSAEFTIGGSINAAVMYFTKALADRGQQDGVRVNAINPGAITTERLQRRIRTFSTEHGVDLDTAAKQMAKSLGVTRFGTPEEIAAMVAFLASPQGAYCQGAIVDIDGGETKTL
jgi:NAD(P)-dependent dehydrogenase (short-subunit alcohol dehydrogenase family)